MKNRLRILRTELDTELYRILQYWMDVVPDRENGGFLARLNNNNQHDPTSPKGLVLNARILWTFSTAYRATGAHAFLPMADRAYDYIMRFFLDKEHGGYYWSVDQSGKVKESRKQVYGNAFCLYGLTAYYQATSRPEVLQDAMDCFAWMERYSFDTTNGGYFEAFTRDWQPIADQRLSEKDANEKKTMNTHLHVLEAYTSLYRSWPHAMVKEKIRLLLQEFRNQILDTSSGHLGLFFSEDWTLQSSLISYGHDIEAAWLLPEAAAVLGEKDLIEMTNAISQRLVDAAKEGIDANGGLWYEMEKGMLSREKHWWPQAEALVGFFHAWQATGKKEYLDEVFRTWDFIKRVLIDRENGEWFWGCSADGRIMEEDKAGFWKCPYHNSRACLELIRRIDILIK